MLLIALRDLQFRLRRFLISVVAVSLILALTLLLAGVAASFDAEVERTLDQLGVDTWIVPGAASGPFLGAMPLAEEAVATVAAVDGVEQAEPMGFFSMTIDESSGTKPITLLGVQPDGIGSPQPNAGRALTGPGQALVDPGVGVDIGETLRIGGQELTVVGEFDRSTLLGGMPNVFVAMDDLQEVAYNGAPVIMSVAVRGAPSDVPPGMKVLTRADAHADLARPLAPAKDTITLISVLLWIVTGCIIGSVIYLSALERVRDFAVFKAIGVSTSWVLTGLMMQAVLLSVVASVVALGVAWLLAPSMSIPVTLPPSVLVFVPVTAVLVSVVGSLAGVRRAVKVDPALAFG